MANPTWGSGPWGSQPWGGPGGSFVGPNVPVVSGKGWGRSSYGVSPYGDSGIGVGVSFVSAVALSTNSVQVTLSGVPQNDNQNSVGDALNPSTWMVQRLDTLAFLDVAYVTIFTPTIYVVYTFEPFGPASVQHVVSSTNMLDQSGNLITPPRSANFAGCVYEGFVNPNTQAANRGVYPQDIANPQSANLTNNVYGGTLVVMANGDYANVSGPELIKKLIYRRLTTPLGAFFHLPNYGIDLPLNQPIPYSKLPALASQVVQQCLYEPEVAQASCTPVMDPQNGVLTLNVQCTLKVTGSNINLAVPINLNSGSFASLPTPQLAA